MVFQSSNVSRMEMIRSLANVELGHVSTKDGDWRPLDGLTLHMVVCGHEHGVLETNKKYPANVSFVKPGCEGFR